MKIINSLEGITQRSDSDVAICRAQQGKYKIRAVADQILHFIHDDVAQLGDIERSLFGLVQNLSRLPDPRFVSSNGFDIRVEQDLACERIECANIRRDNLTQFQSASHSVNRSTGEAQDENLCGCRQLLRFHEKADPRRHDFGLSLASPCDHYETIAYFGLHYRLLLFIKVQHLCCHQCTPLSVVWMFRLFADGDGHR